MTRDQIIGLAARELEDVTGIHFTNEDLTDSCQDGYDLIALLTQCIERVGTVSQVANKIYYDFTSLPGYFRVFAIYNNTNKQWLTPKPHIWLNNYGYRWEMNTGSIKEFSPIGYKHIIVNQKPTAVNADTLTVYYNAVAPTLSGDSIPEFYPELHDILVQYIIQDLLDQNLEYTKSQKYFAKFVILLDKLKQKLDNRSMPDRIHTLQCHYLTNLI